MNLYCDMSNFGQRCSV